MCHGVTGSPQLFALFVGLPLALIRNIELFSIPSTLSQLGIFYAVAVVSYYGFGDLKENKKNPG